jgi:voltage-gated potassium channel
VTLTQRWERATDWPLMVAALSFLVAYAVPIMSPDLSTGERRVRQIVVWVTWAVFVLDYLVRLLLAESRARWFLVHLLDLAIIALPLLRLLRLLRLVTLLNVLNRTASTELRGTEVAALHARLDRLLIQQDGEEARVDLGRPPA